MATTTGIVELVVPAGATAAGSPAEIRLRTPDGASVDLTVSPAATDGPATSAAKAALVALLEQARLAGWPVTVDHTAAEVDAVTIGGYDIKPVGPAIVGDFFTVTGSDIPADAEVVLQPAAGRPLRFEPSLVRPDWIFVGQLPRAIPPGRYSMWLATPEWSTDAVPVDVLASGPRVVRALNPGAPKAAPYTVAFVANPAYIPRPVPATGPRRDPAVTDRTRFQGAVLFCLKTLLQQAAEDLVRQFDPDIRFVALFDAAPAGDATALLEEHPTESTILTPRRATIQAFLAARGLAADLVFVLAGSNTYERASTAPTTDDAAAGGQPFEYDRFSGLHGRFPSVPGTVALPMRALQGPIAFHEFCHAAAEAANGLVIDLYTDRDLPGFPLGLRVNKKWRNRATEDVPDDFATYAGTVYASARNRAGAPYGPGWLSYHAAPTDPGRPNLMDTYEGADDPMACRLDQLTRQWLLDRLQAKLSR